MKKEFLTNFKVSGQPLPDEVVEAILAENGRDLAAFADHETIKQQLAEAQKTIKGFEGQDIEGVRKAAKDWEDKYNQAVAEHNQKMADMAFDHALEAAITGMKGRNVKGIRANLDLEALKASKNQEADIKSALDALKKSDGYLFDTGDVPPPYASGTGTGPVGGQNNGFNFGFTGVRAHETGKS